MKKTSLALRGFLCVALLYAGACASVEKNAYAIIGTAITTVDAGMTLYGQEVRAGQIPADVQAKVKAAYEKYVKAINGAQTAVAAYKSQTGAKDKAALDAALGGLSASVAGLWDLFPAGIKTAAAAKGTK